MFGWLIDIFKDIIQFLYSITHNYGVAIILFTIIIRMLLYPLTAKQQKSMKKMQDLQPEMEKIKEKYKDNKEKQNEEMMNLYKEKNVNPAAGCLPMILTMLIIIPLFRAIHGMGEVMQDASFLWISSLAEPDIPLLVINVLAMIGQTYFMQKFSGNNQSNAMMWVMPIMIAVIGFSFPAGVLIYWFTQTVIAVVQQYFIHRDPEPKGAA